jgi:ribosome maturation factor RimP
MPSDPTRLDPPGAVTPAKAAPDPARVRVAIADVVEPVVAAHRCELVDLEYRRESVGWVLRLYVEHLGHDPRLTIGGVGIDECARISRDVSTALDVADLLQHAYHLEVSSPGLERPLTRAEHWRRFVGLRAKVRLERPLDGHGDRKAFKGEILAEQAGIVAFRDDELGELAIPLDRVARAHLVYEPAPKLKPGRKPAARGSRAAAPHEKPAGTSTASTPRDAADAETMSTPRGARGASENDR